MFIRIWINLGAIAVFLHQEDLPSYNISTKDYHPEKKGNTTLYPHQENSNSERLKARHQHISRGLKSMEWKRWKVRGKSNSHNIPQGSLLPQPWTGLLPNH